MSNPVHRPDLWGLRPQDKFVIAKFNAAGQQEGLFIGGPNAPATALATAINPVSITGTPQTGSVLTATLATGWAVGSYQWKRDGSNISGATSATYTLVEADEDKTISVTVGTITYTAPGVAVTAAS